MTQSFDFFLSYSRRDAVLVRQLYNRLTREGFALWLDVDRILPGQDWALEIERAIKQCRAVITCVSSSWIDDEGFVHDELRQALERMRRLPQGRIFLIPVRLDECKLPDGIADLHYIDLQAPKGFASLIKALSSFSSDAKSDAVQSQAREWSVVADMVCAGTAEVLSVDHWNMALSSAGLAFKKLLRGRFEVSGELYNEHRHQELIELWSPLFGLEHFQTDHFEWRDAPYFRCQIHASHCQLFAAYIFLGQGEMSKRMEYFPLAMKELAQVVAENPYSMAGGSDDRLPREAARVQNENYRGTLHLAKQFLESWGGGGMEIFGVPRAEALRVEDQVDRRIAALTYVLQH